MTSVVRAFSGFKDACYRARNFCVFSRIQKETPGLMHKGCVLQRVFLGTLSVVTVVVGMRRMCVDFHIGFHHGDG